MKAGKKQVRSEANEGLIASTRWPKEATSGDCWFIYGAQHSRQAHGDGSGVTLRKWACARLIWRRPTSWRWDSGRGQDRVMSLSVYMGGPCGWFPRAFRSKILSSVRHCDVAFPRLHIFIIVSRSISNSSSSITPSPPLVSSEMTVQFRFITDASSVCQSVLITTRGRHLWQVTRSHFLTSLSNIIHFSASAALTATQVATAYRVPFILSHFFALGIFCFIFYRRCSAVITATSLPIGKKIWPPVKSNLMNRLCQLKFITVDCSSDWFKKSTYPGL